MPRLNKFYLGFFIEGRLSGVAALGWGTQPLQTIRKLFPCHVLRTTDYIEIGKMCFLPDLNNTQCFGSLAISQMVKWLKANTRYLYLYTLADGIMGKCGYVYQASNFQYVGSFTTSVYRDSLTGEKIHPRSARLLLEENAAFDGVAKRYWLTFGYCQYKGILAPTYETGCRDGCWMCHNQGVNQLRQLRHDYPHLWALLLNGTRIAL